MDDPDGVRDALLAGGRGQLLVCTHLGNLDVCRAMAEIGEGVALNVLMHLPNAAHFNRLLGESGDRRLRLMHVGDLDTSAMLELSQRLERGEWIAIAGDRVPEHGGRVGRHGFPGRDRRLPARPMADGGDAALPGEPRLLPETRRPLSHPPASLRRCRPAGSADSAMPPSPGAVTRLCRMAGRTLSLGAPLQWFNFHAYWHGTNGAPHAR